MIDHLNYHHLSQFCVVVRTGGIQAAARKLRIAPSALSSQLKTLESHLGLTLFRRANRRLTLTSAGERIFAMAQSIFVMGERLRHQVNSGDLNARSVRMGVTDGVPKLVTARVIQQLKAQGTTSVYCPEGSLSQLLPGLADFSLDILLSNEGAGVYATSHLTSCHIGDSPMAIYARSVDALGTDAFSWMASTDWILPLLGSSMRYKLDEWFAANGLQPRIFAEVEDTALMKTLAGESLGAVALPRMIGAELFEQYALKCLYELGSVTESYYLFADSSSKIPEVKLH